MRGFAPKQTPSSELKTSRLRGLAPSKPPYHGDRMRTAQPNLQRGQDELEDHRSSRLSWDFSRISVHPVPAAAFGTTFAINQPGGQHEQEADGVANQVTRRPSPAAGRPVPSIGADQQHMQERPSGSANQKSISAPTIVHKVLSSPGRSIDAATRALMQPRFSHDLSQVRIHTDSAAGRSARDLNANAYTVGPNIVFAPGRYAPNTASGKRLLAHELTHVVQQSLPEGSQPGVDHEQEAEAAEAGPLSAPMPVALSSAPGSLQCSPAGKTRDNSGRREAVVQVVWSQDSWDLGDRLVAAVAHNHAFRGIPESSLPQALNPAAGALTGDPANAPLKPGHRVKIRVSLVYDPENIPELSSISVVIAETQSSPADAKRAPTATAPGGSRVDLPSRSAPAQLQRADPSFKDQEASLLRTYSQLAAQADHNGKSGIVFTIGNNGRALDPYSFEAVGDQQARPSGIAELSPQSAAAELQNSMDTIAEHPGKWRVTVLRDPRSGAMHFKSIERIEGAAPPPAPASQPGRQLTESEQFERETGVVDPRRINQRLHDVGVQALKQANPFSLKNLPYTIAGVIVPIGAMKLLTMDTGELSGLVRFEWQIDQTVVEESEAGAVSSSGATPPATAANTTRELQVGDIIPTAKGSQRVVEIKPGSIVTEPYDEAAAGQLSADAKTPASATAAEKPAGAATTHPEINDLIKNSTPGKQSAPGMGSSQFDRQGGLAQANADFDVLASGKPIKSYPNGIRSTELPDGTTISVRPDSGKGPSTLQINSPTGNPIKIRYP
jgi:hypothetical protein